jgi:hypothetical protein
VAYAISVLTPGAIRVFALRPSEEPIDLGDGVSSSCVPHTFLDTHRKTWRRCRGARISPAKPRF